LFQTVVACDGGDAEDLDLWRLQRQEKRHGIIRGRPHSKVSIQDDAMMNWLAGNV
jgi:hypothetical protein